MRKTAIYTVADEGRDKGNAYLLTEMPASKAEMWAARAFFAMANNGIEVPADLKDSGIAGMARFALQLLGKLPFSEAVPLFAEMMECVQRIPDPNNPSFVRALVENDIEEVKTRMKLRGEVLKLHSDFFKAVVPSTSASTPAA